MLYPAFIGAVLAASIFLFARWQRWDHDSSLYPTVLIVIAQYYVLFALIDGAENALIFQLIVACLFVLVAIIGRNAGGPIIAFAIMAHGIYDLGFHWFGTGGGVPIWWPAFCSAVDLILGVAILLARPRQAPTHTH